jgi:hypothetical protein
MVRVGPPVEGKAESATDPENPFTLDNVTISVVLDP